MFKADWTHFRFVGLHDEALALADVVYIGTKLAWATEQIVAGLATRCLLLQGRCALAANPAQRRTASAAVLAAGGDAEMGEAEGVNAMDTGATAADGLALDASHPVLAESVAGRAAAAKASWTQLEGHLKRYEAAAPRGYRLRLVAAEAILAQEPRFCLPPWLLAPFVPPRALPPASVLGQSGVAGASTTPASTQPEQAAFHAADYGALVRLYMRHHRLHDAAKVATRHLEVVTQSVPSVALPKTGAVCYPHALLQELLVQMEGAADAATQRLRTELAELVGQERAAAEKQTDVIARIYAA